MVSFGRNRSFRSLSNERRKYRIEMSLLGFIGFGAVLLFGIIWIFILGILVGRGYQPEQAIPQLERILPSMTAENAVVGTTDGAPGDTLSNATGNAMGNATGDMGMLTPEELEFQHVLKENPQPESAPKPAPEKAQPKPAAEPTPAPTPKEATAPAQPERETTAQSAPSNASPAPGAFRYVYQAASFKDIKRAEQLKARIEELGFGSGIERSEQGTSVWNRVTVVITATPEQVDGLKEKLKPLGLGKPLLRSKTPVSP